MYAGSSKTLQVALKIEEKKVFEIFISTKGDSSGPLMCKDKDTKKWILHGIYAFGIYRAEEKVTMLDMHTWTFAYDAWISDRVNDPNYGSALCRRCSPRGQCM